MTRSYQLSNYTDAYNPKEAGLADLQLQFALPDVHIDVSLEKEDGVTVGTHLSTQRKEHSPLATSLLFIMRIPTLKK